MRCQNCGNLIPESAAVCPSCQPITLAGAIAIPVAADGPSAGAGEKVKTAAADALHAFKTFAANPVGGLPIACENLGEARAMAAGLAFGAVFSLCVLLGAYRIIPVWFRPEGFGGFLKMVVASLVPFASLFGATVAVHKTFRGQGGIGNDSFLAGASSLPFGFVLLLGTILGAGNLEVTAIFSSVAVCTTILMLFAGLTRVCKLSERLATLAVPLILLATAWLSKVIYAVILHNSGTPASMFP